jgi:hypothetical protein
MTQPDFRIWAENIITMARQFGTAQDEIERALEQAFQQGVDLGSRKNINKIGETLREWYKQEMMEQSSACPHYKMMGNEECLICGK